MSMIQLKDICTKIGSGATPTGGKSAYLSQGISLIRSQNVLDYTFTMDGLAYINEDQAMKLNNVEVQKGDILLNITGDSVARVCIVPDNVLPARVNQHVAIIRVDEDKADNNYVLYSLIKSKKSLLSLAGGGATRNALTKKMIEEFEIELPQLSIQKKISAQLSEIDDKIAVNRRICENLEAQAQALFKHWFIDFAPFKNGKFVESELGMIPEGWRVGTLGEYIQVKRGGSPRPIQKYLSKEGMNWLKISDATASDSPFIMSIKEKIIEEGLNHTIFRNAGSLVLSNSATPCIPKFLGVDTCIHDGWLYFPNSQLSNEYLYLFFQRMRKSLLLKANGSVFLNLKTDIVKSQSFVCPTQKIMEDFDRIITHLFKTIFNLTQESSRLSTLRDTLLPKLMSGQIKV